MDNSLNFYLGLKSTLYAVQEALSVLYFQSHDQFSVDVECWTVKMDLQGIFTFEIKFKYKVNIRVTNNTILKN